MDFEHLDDVMKCEIEEMADLVNLEYQLRCPDYKSQVLEDMKYIKIKAEMNELPYCEYVLYYATLLHRVE